MIEATIIALTAVIAIAGLSVAIWSIFITRELASATNDMARKLWPPVDNSDLNDLLKKATKQVKPETIRSALDDFNLNDELPICGHKMCTDQGGCVDE